MVIVITHILPLYAKTPFPVLLNYAIDETYPAVLQYLIRQRLKQCLLLDFPKSPLKEIETKSSKVILKNY
jgi:hypothetical protein